MRGFNLLLLAVLLLLSSTNCHQPIATPIAINQLPSTQLLSTKCKQPIVINQVANHLPPTTIVNKFSSTNCYQPIVFFTPTACPPTTNNKFAVWCTWCSDPGGNVEVACTAASTNHCPSVCGEVVCGFSGPTILAMNLFSNLHCVGRSIAVRGVASAHFSGSFLSQCVAPLRRSGLRCFCTSADAMCAVCTGHHSSSGNSEIEARRQPHAKTKNQTNNKTTNQKASFRVWICRWG